jgi:hypothetical protein
MLGALARAWRNNSPTRLYKRERSLKLHYHPARRPVKLFSYLLGTKALTSNTSWSTCLRVRISIPTSKVEPDLIGTSPLG